VKNEEVKIKLNDLYEHYKNNSLDDKDIKKIEQYKKIINNISEKRRIEINHELIDSPEKIDEIYKDFRSQISGSEMLSDVNDLTKLIETSAPHVALVLAILTNHLELASMIVFHQLYMGKLRKI